MKGCKPPRICSNGSSVDGASAIWYVRRVVKKS
jgi:hypothetical protein